jgi:hypothetical protein
MGYEPEVVWERLVRDYRNRVETEGGVRGSEDPKTRPGTRYA